MKKSGITFILFAIIFLIAVGVFFCKPKENTEYLRIHIRANSNSNEDQEVKYKIKEKVVEFLTPLISNCDTKEKAEKTLSENLKGIEKTADKVLIENGFNYKSSAKINNEKFPTRVYNDFTLEEGYYDALIINLGSGKGDNWWCVVYPPLCFTEGKLEYRSKIIDLINKFKENR